MLMCHLGTDVLNWEFTIKSAPAHRGLGLLSPPPAESPARAGSTCSCGPERRPLRRPWPRSRCSTVVVRAGGEGEVVPLTLRREHVRILQTFFGLGKDRPESPEPTFPGAASREASASTNRRTTRNSPRERAQAKSFHSGTRPEWTYASVPTSRPAFTAVPTGAPGLGPLPLEDVS